LHVLVCLTATGIRNGCAVQLAKRRCCRGIDVGLCQQITVWAIAVGDSIHKIHTVVVAWHLAFDQCDCFHAVTFANPAWRKTRPIAAKSCPSQNAQPRGAKLPPKSMICAMNGSIKLSPINTWRDGHCAKFQCAQPIRVPDAHRTKEVGKTLCARTQS